MRDQYREDMAERRANGLAEMSYGRWLETRMRQSATFRRLMVERKRRLAAGGQACMLDDSY